MLCGYIQWALLKVKVYIAIFTFLNGELLQLRLNNEMLLKHGLLPKKGM